MSNKFADELLYHLSCLAEGNSAVTWSELHSVVKSALESCNRPKPLCVGEQVSLRVGRSPYPVVGIISGTDAVYDWEVEVNGNTFLRYSHELTRVVP